MFRSGRPWLMLPVLALSAAALALAWRHDVGWATLAANRAALHRAADAAPAATILLYCTAYVGVVVLSLPLSAVFTLAGGLLFGTAAGAALATLSSAAGAVLLFLLARGALAPSVARRAGPWLDRLRPGLRRDGFSYLLALRLIPLVPFWLLNLAPALLGMRLAPYAAATLLGVVPAAVIFAGIGSGLDTVFAAGAEPDLSVLRSPPVLLPLAGLACLSLLPVAWRRLRRA